MTSAQIVEQLHLEPLSNMATALSLQNGQDPLTPTERWAPHHISGTGPRDFFSSPATVICWPYSYWTAGRDYPLELSQFFKWHHRSSPFSLYQAGLCANISSVNMHKSRCSPGFPCWSDWVQHPSKSRCPHLHNGWSSRQKTDARINQTSQGKCSVKCLSTPEMTGAAGLYACRVASCSPASVIGPLCPCQHRYS